MIICFSFKSTNSLSCDSCGSECARACGTRHFRTCCFNYVKKRSGSFHPYALNRLNYDSSYYSGPPARKFAQSPNEEKEIKRKSDKLAKTNDEIETFYNGRSQITQQQTISEDLRQNPDIFGIGI